MVFEKSKDPRYDEKCLYGKVLQWLRGSTPFPCPPKCAFLENVVILKNHTTLKEKALLWEFLYIRGEHEIDPSTNLSWVDF